METENQNHQEDKLAAALELYEKEQKEFENHWVWNKLGCKPEQFFDAVKTHVDSMNLSNGEWEEAMDRAKEISRVRAAEKQATFDANRFQMMAGIQV